LVQELVKLHGGNVHVQSVVGKGTTFTVQLPLGSAHLPHEQVGSARCATATALGPRAYVEEALRWLPDDESAPAKAASELPHDDALPLHAPAAAGPLPRVLVADDNADMRQYVARLLGERYQVETARDGAAALAAATHLPPDLVLTDIMMPGMNGFELLKALRADSRTATVPVIMLSARAGEESRVEGMDAGADDYLIKPFSARELLARVKAHLEIARVRRQSAGAIARRRSQER
jgi:CheY-like chemotaxis protein